MQPDTEVQTLSQTNKPNRRLFLAGLVFALVALAGFYRFGWYAVHSILLWQMVGPFVLWYQLNVSFIWGVFSGWVAWGCLVNTPWSRILVMMAVTAFSAAFWIDRLIISVNPVDARWQMYLLINILVFILMFSWMYPPSFRKEH